MFFHRSIVLSIVIISQLLNGCSFKDKLAEEINKNFPPISLDKIREDSVAKNAFSLNSANSADMRIVINQSILNATLDSAVDLKKEGVKSATVKFERQVPSFKLEFDKIFQINNKLTVQAEGSFEGYLSVEFEFSDAANDNLGKIKFHPFIENTTVSNVKINDEYDATNIARLLTDLINKYKENISGILGKNIDPVVFPITLEKNLDPNSFTVSESGELRVIGNKVNISASVENISYLASKSYLDVILDMDGDRGLSGSTDKASYNFEEYKKMFQERAETIGGKASSNIELFASTNYFLDKISQAADDAEIIILGEFKPKGAYDFSEKIGLPSEDSINCTPTRNCSADHINCTPTRNCTPTKNCGGYKWYQAPDKARCELEKSAAKLDCERIKSSQKAECETKKSAWKLDCERIKTQQKVACETEKEVVKRINRTGNFANIKGSVAVESKIEIQLKKVKFHDGGAEVKLDVGGLSKFDTNMRFTPLDIVGHMACQAPWRDRFATEAELVPQEIALDVNYKIKSKEDNLIVSMIIKPISVSAVVNPSPKQLIMNSQEFTIHCLPLAGLIRAVDIALPDIIPDEVNGNVEYEQGQTEINHSFELQPVKVGDKKYNLQIIVSDQYISAAI